MTWAAMTPEWVAELLERLERVPPMTEIQPCWGCDDGKPDIVWIGVIRGAQVVCHNCKCSGPARFTSDEAIKAWNTVSDAMAGIRILENLDPNLYDAIEAQMWDRQS